MPSQAFQACSALGRRKVHWTFRFSRGHSSRTTWTKSSHPENHALHLVQRALIACQGRSRNRPRQDAGQGPMADRKCIGSQAQRPVAGTGGDLGIILAMRHMHIPFVRGAGVEKRGIQRACFLIGQLVPVAQIDFLQPRIGGEAVRRTWPSGFSRTICMVECKRAAAGWRHRRWQASCPARAPEFRRCAAPGRGHSPSGACLFFRKSAFRHWPRFRHAVRGKA